MTESDWDNLADKPSNLSRAGTSGLSDALRNQAVQNELKDLRRHVINLDEQMEAMRKERDSLMRYGLMTLGAAVVGMGLYIWHLLADGRIK